MTPTLVLDLDGTLVDSVPDLAAALNRLMQARAIMPFSQPEVAAMVGDGAAALIARAFTARALQPDAAALADFLADYGAHAAIASFAYPGVTETLRAMEDSGWRFAVCTNKPEAPARGLLQALGLAGFFAAVGGGDSFLKRKPDPSHVLATLAIAGGDPRHAVMVGDHHNDVLAAHGAGMPCIFASWGYGARSMGAKADAIAERFIDIPDLARSLLKNTERTFKTVLES